ncbi:hypothetical protein ACJIZ3_012305 [Penstemon smallii]|uniref:Ninja-family protein n=1 Tax=Penstemon smallii TaxID=265156 RepID=A0ABD3UPU2_9LAMI
MGKECSIEEVLKVPNGKEDEFELSLELSLGGSYGKLEKLRKIEGKRYPFEENENGFSRSDFSCGRGVGELNRRRDFVDLQNKGGNVGDKLILLEAQQFQNRVEDREKREKEYLGPVGLSKSKYEREQQMQRHCLFPQIGNGCCAVVQSSSSMSGGFDSGISKVSNGSLERSSSAVSDNQSTSQRGGRNSDTGSHSNSLITCQIQNAPKGRHTFEKLDTYNDFSSRTETNQFYNVLVQEPCTMVAPLSIRHQSNPSSSTEKSRALFGLGKKKDTSSGLIGTPQNKNYNEPSVSGMPCVWTTGDGPNGRTITGFLYKYDKYEVSIMCVCHGSSFSPAGFVEHAGGVDVSHPLKHITVVPPSSGL